MSELQVKKEMEVVDGVYTLNSVEEQMKYASFLISKKLVSDTFKDPAQLMVAIQLCKDLNLPNSCLKDFYVIGGKPAIFGDTFVALALGAGVIAEHKVTFHDENGDDISIPKKGAKLFSCVITGRRAGSSLTSTVSFSLDDLASSGNNNPNFKKHPRDMLFRRSMGRFIKWICADAIRGVEMADYAEEAQPSEGKRLVQTFNEAADQDFPIPPEEKTVGPLYRIQNAKYRGKQLYQIPLEELIDYAQTLRNRTTPKKTWEVELISVIDSYAANIDSFRPMILDLMSEEE